MKRITLLLVVLFFGLAFRAAKGRAATARGYLCRRVSEFRGGAREPSPSSKRGRASRRTTRIWRLRTARLFGISFSQA